MSEVLNKYAKILDKNKKDFIEFFWMNLGDTSKITTTNSIGDHELFKENPTLAVIDMMRRPENFAFTCKTLLNVDLLLFQGPILKILWNHSFPMLIGTRGLSKTWMLAVYCLLRALFTPGSKIVITGASFRQSKFIFSYCEAIWKNAPMLRDILSCDKNNKPLHDMDMYTFTINDSTITSIPIGDGEKVRGLRASCLLTDEYNSINRQIFEEVLQGFLTTSMNPVERVKQKAELKALLELGEISPELYKLKLSERVSNQHIISGTCGYTFENLYKDWKKYRDIILSNGDANRMKQLIGDDYSQSFTYKDFAIVRIPYNILPEDYLDEKTIMKAKATSNSGTFGSEFGAIFMSDSQGFFKRSLIEHCTVLNTSPPIIKKGSTSPVEFYATLEGDSNRKYVIAIDPAAEKDNLAIIVLAIYPDHRRIVYCWTITDAKHKAKLRAGEITEHDYYRYCARKIRDLMKVFPCDNIVMDAQGGGKPIKEVLGDPSYLQPGEHPIYPVKDIEKPLNTDYLPGLHILHMIQFSNAEWVYDANHGLRQDMETTELLFPVKDSLAFGMAREQDILYQRFKTSDDDPNAEDCYDTLEDCMLEIEELKNELVLIEHTKTPSGRDHWDTPQVKGLNSKKGRLRKDRYSALLMANMAGRSLIGRLVEDKYPDYGGLAHQMVKEKKSKDFSIGIGVIGKRRF